jgi:hypothetical protein
MPRDSHWFETQRAQLARRALSDSKIPRTTPVFSPKDRIILGRCGRPSAPLGSTVNGPPYPSFPSFPLALTQLSNSKPSPHRNQKNLILNRSTANRYTGHTRQTLELDLTNHSCENLTPEIPPISASNRRGFRPASRVPANLPDRPKRRTQMRQERSVPTRLPEGFGGQANHGDIKSHTISCVARHVCVPWRPLPWLRAGWGALAKGRRRHRKCQMKPR